MMLCTTRPGDARPATVALITITALTLAACGGGGGDGGDPPGRGTGGTVPTPSINALTGDWRQKGCVRIGTQSFKKILRAGVIGQSTIDYSEGVLTYSGTECVGASQLAGPSRLGTVTVARSEANQTLATHWGEFHTVTGSRFGAIWTLQSNNLLCLLGDEIPTNQGSLAAVSASLATVPADNCFTR